MLKFLRAGYFRHFLSGFAIGAIGLVAVQTAQPENPPMYSASAVTDSVG
ncbi:hypothetical protein OKW76_10645 [Sphingomonas sp. S1-29]|uniref:Uncharacterized protein n=1 Tax=Sphingomonas qomolangmaensis TaxID=2918765 RepID=A0ABY5L882_9SPHN|nr:MULTISPECIES: hypothetical protein [Sphingomonas]UUL81960.1 hypothetical protein NMP03_12290 [Sphingomonas qomolangmaensis]UZK68513.1 hypothetical protein OKW76_10645 [Sphingomonas sp. S1-29]